MTVLTTYALRLPKSIKAAAEQLSSADGTSLNQFVTTAVAEKIAVMNTAAFFSERTSRAARGKGSVLAGLLSRAGGDPPQLGDEPSADQTKTALALNKKTVKRKLKA
jgi:hypothetical protein